MMSFVLGHIGLGDQILCNAIIRDVSKWSDMVFLPVKKHNLFNIKDMLKDLNNINFLAVNDDAEMIKYYDLSKNMISNTIAIGIFGNNFMNGCRYFDESFYKQASVEYIKRWENFKYIKDPHRQKSVSDMIRQQFIFVHDDHSRNLKIKDHYLNKEITLFRPRHNLGTTTEFSIFDYIDVLERAEEIHCMDSSFACMIDHIPELRQKKKFIHRYVRKNSNNPNYMNNWIIIND